MIWLNCYIDCCSLHPPSCHVTIYHSTNRGGGQPMNLDFNSTQSTRYLQVYNYYKDLIVTGRLMPGTKMPSIRRGAIQLGLSRTTIETAYLCLAADGYIISRPQSGYYVTDRTINSFSSQNAHNTKTSRHTKIKSYTILHPIMWTQRVLISICGGGILKAHCGRTDVC